MQEERYSPDYTLEPPIVTEERQEAILASDKTAPLEDHSYTAWFADRNPYAIPLVQTEWQIGEIKSHNPKLISQVFEKFGSDLVRIAFNTRHSSEERVVQNLAGQLFELACYLHYNQVTPDNEIITSPKDTAHLVKGHYHRPDGIALVRMISGNQSLVTGLHEYTMISRRDNMSSKRRQAARYRDQEFLDLLRSNTDNARDKLSALIKAKYPHFPSSVAFNNQSRKLIYTFPKDAQASVMKMLRGDGHSTREIDYASDNITAVAQSFFNDIQHLLREGYHGANQQLPDYYRLDAINLLRAHQQSSDDQ